MVEADDGLVVFDPGLPIVARQALTLIERGLGRPAGDVHAVMCTHAHPDHIAGVSSLEAATGCGAHLPKRCADYLDGEQPRVFPLMESSVRFAPVWGGW